MRDLTSVYLRKSAMHYSINNLEIKLLITGNNGIHRGEARMALLDLDRGDWLFGEKPMPVKVLIVDDDEEDIYLLKRLLRRSRNIAYTVFACGDLDEGAAIAVAEGVDLLLVDFFLGIGISIDSRRPNHAALSRPFILLSGLHAPDLEEVARGAGAIGFLGKGGLTVEALDEFALQTVNAPRAASISAPSACVSLPD